MSKNWKKEKNINKTRIKSVYIWSQIQKICQGRIVWYSYFLNVISKITQTNKEYHRIYIIIEIWFWTFKKNG